MCSICGGTQWDWIAEHIWKASIDRGRDDEGKIHSTSGRWIGNRRATPTTEVEKPTECQPVGPEGGPYFVFNGIIANDDDLGVQVGEADTSVLPRTLKTNTLMDFGGSLNKLFGSFAIAVMANNGQIWLACNYKPIWVLEYQGQVYFSSLKQHFPALVRRLAYRFPPYSYGVLGEMTTHDLPREQPDNALVIASSGLDSTAVAAYAVMQHMNTCLLHFDYGCRAGEREKSQIRKIAEVLNCDVLIMPLTNTTVFGESIFGNKSTLMNLQNQVTQGKAGAEYAHEWVPARNLVMLAMTTAIAEAYNFGHIYLGTNLEEAGAYPDNEEQFILDFNSLLYGAVNLGYKVQIHTPLGGLMKHEIVPFGLRYEAPFSLTWSCYEGGDKHCGKCGPCFMRKTAFARNGLKDPVEYEQD